MEDLYVGIDLHSSNSYIHYCPVKLGRDVRGDVRQRSIRG